jgi:hypothetical protein
MCDYAGHAILYVALAALLDDTLGWWAWPLATLAAVSRAAQSNHAESQRRTYLWRAYGVPWLQQTRPRDHDLSHRPGLGSRIMSGAAGAYLALANALSPSSKIVDGAVARAAGDLVARRRLKRMCKAASRHALFLQLILGANYRTLLLGLSMAAGSPLWFFLAESVAFNLLLLLSIRAQKRANARLAARLEDAERLA